MAQRTVREALEKIKATYVAGKLMPTRYGTLDGRRCGIGCLLEPETLTLVMGSFNGFGIDRVARWLEGGWRRLEDETGLTQQQLEAVQCELDYGYDTHILIASINNILAHGNGIIRGTMFVL